MSAAGDPTAWMDHGNCLGVDTDLFFPERGESHREAKGVCRGCVVREECLEFALVNGEKFGIWGGMSERQRRRIRRQRAQAGIPLPFRCMCTGCGAGFVSAGRTEKYCAECRAEIERQPRNAAQRRMRDRAKEQAG